MGAEKVSLLGSAPCENWDFLAPLREEKPDVICADGGIQLALQAGFTPTAYVGDGDSGGVPPEGVPHVLLPRVKDVTDLEQALHYALAQGYRHIIMTGCTGGRQDHHLANLTLLEQASRQGAEARILDPTHEIRCLIGPASLQAEGKGYRYFGLIPMDRQVSGVCIQNAKYPLQNATLVRGSTLSVSNEPLQGPVTVSVEQGAVLFLFTKE